uniref:Peptidase_M14 domain-containing protein n=1 Tax=Heterorhabditis bacteriophora TaxID=37862 RepID=A0A1I7WT83_HETBA
MPQFFKRFRDEGGNKAKESMPGNGLPFIQLFIFLTGFCFLIFLVTHISRFILLFLEIGSSSDRCSEIYQGSAPFSEAEARAVRDTMFSPDIKGKVDAFITLHTYSQMWIHPFSHQRKTVPEDISDITISLQEQVGRRAVSALENVFGTKYRFGTGADILFWDGFILDSRQLVPTGKETWTGIKVVIEAVLDRIKRAKLRHKTVSKSTNPIAKKEYITTISLSQDNMISENLEELIVPIPYILLNAAKCVVSAIVKRNNVI